MATLKKVLAVVWDHLVVIFGAYTALRLLFVVAMSVGETRPAYVIDWAHVGFAAALVLGFTFVGWELRRLVKGE